MPIQARGPFPKPPTSFRDEGRGSKATIEEYRALKNMPRSDEALKLLREIGKIVQPIMLKNGWRLPLLVEVYPTQESLLGFNVNAGQKIALRLRFASNHESFFDESSLVETMLHELTHNLRGPHDEIFYQHLDTLTKEWYELQRSDSNKILEGQGFLSEGFKLGGSRGGNGPIDPRRARQRAVEMAEKRKRLGEIMANGSNRLGGSTNPVSLAAARADAAERRRNITHSCPNDSLQETQVAAQEQEEQEHLHGIQVITIDDDDDDDDDNEERSSPVKIVEAVPKVEVLSSDEDEVVITRVKKAPKKTTSQTVSTAPSHLVNQTRAAAALRQNLLTDSSDLEAFQQGFDKPSSSDVTHHSRPWVCQLCTLRNSHSALVCQACNDIRPGLPHWICSHCHHKMLGDYAQYWLCTKCSQIKTA